MVEREELDVAACSKVSRHRCLEVTGELIFSVNRFDRILGLGIGWIDLDEGTSSFGAEAAWRSLATRLRPVRRQCVETQQVTGLALQ